MNRLDKATWFARVNAYVTRHLGVLAFDIAAQDELLAEFEEDTHWSVAADRAVRAFALEMQERLDDGEETEERETRWPRKK